MLAKFLRHLSQCSLEVIEKPDLEAYDIGRLKRELMQLQRHIDGNETIHPEVLRDIIDLKVNVDETLLDGDRSAMFLMLAARLHFPGAALLRARRVERVEQARHQVEDFHSSLEHIMVVLSRKA